MSSLKRNSLCSASLVNRDTFFAMCSSVLSFKRFSLLPTSCLLRFISSRELSLSQCELLFLVHSFLRTSFIFVLLYCPLCCSRLLLMLPRYPRVASLVAVSPCRSQVASCLSRFGLLLSVSGLFIIHFRIRQRVA